MKRFFVLAIISVLLLVLMSVFLIHRSNKRKGLAMPVVLSIGMSADYQPFSFFDGSMPAGFDVDLVKEIAKKLNKDFVLHDVPFELLLSKVHSGEYMLAIGGITNTKQRTKNVLFSDVYYEHDTFSVLAPIEGKKIESIGDLAGKRIAVIASSTAQEYVKSIPNSIVVSVPSIHDMILTLKAGDAQVAIIATQTVKSLLTKYGAISFTIFPLSLIEESYAIAIDPAYATLQTEINRALRELREAGVIDMLKLKWGLQ